MFAADAARPTLLVVDDLTQYLWHRLSHTSWMWPFHRAHHAALGGKFDVQVFYFKERHDQARMDDE